jgi:UDP-glucuronate decarboxylase
MQALHNHDITIYGDGNQTRSFCYVDDLIRGMVDYMELDSKEPGPINLGNPVEFTIRELAESVITLTGSQSQIITKPLPEDDPKQRQPDITLAKKILDWEPTIQLEEGLLKTISYFSKSLSA